MEGERRLWRVGAGCAGGAIGGRGISTADEPGPWGPLASALVQR